MSNDIKLAAKGALANAACTSAGVNVAQVFRPEAVDFSRPACPDEGRVFRAFRVPTSLSGRGEAVGFSGPVRPQLTAQKVTQEGRVMSPTATLNRPISNRFWLTNRIRRNLQKTNDEKISNRGQNTL
jgi:hypothetical protein